MPDDRWWSEFDAVVAAALAPGSRILDVGCGDGGLVDRLGALGFDALGVDPRAPAHPRLIQERVEQATGLGEFDAVTAVMALHHAELDAVVGALRKLVRPGGRLFLNELAWDAFDERAAAWLGDHGADHSVAGWRRARGELHRATTIKQALSADFEPTLEVRRPYLARMLRRPELEPDEQALIDAHRLPALGLWYVARRT